VDARFENAEEYALNLGGAEIHGSVFLGYEEDARPLHAVGHVDFTGARIDGEVRCDGVRFEGPVWFIGAHIKGDLTFSRNHFSHSVKRSELILSAAEIGRRLFFVGAMGAVESISLRAANVGALVDDAMSWRIADWLLLDGFCYGRFIDAEVFDPSSRMWTRHFSPTDAKTRIEWLDHQRDEDLENNFKPQPWEQLIKVLRELGHEEAVRQVAIEKQKRIRKGKYIPALLHRLYGMLCGYGYRPGFLLAWALGVFVIGAILFKLAAVLGVMAPMDRRITEEVKDIACRPERGGNWATCSSLHRRGYPSFDPILYSLDLILPVISTQQTKDWAPLTTTPCREITWSGTCQHSLEEEVMSNTSGYWWPAGVLFWLAARLENLLGWAFGLMFVAIVSGWIKKD
jgi:hypothetical protein